MTTGLETTFALLTTTANEAAEDLLLAALDHSNAAIRDSALRALLRRPSPPAYKILIERLHTFDDRWRAMIAERHEGLASAVRDAILAPVEQLCENGCQAMLWFKEYDLLPALLNATEDTANPQRLRTASALLRLVERFYEELSGPRDYSNRRDPQRLREKLVQFLEASVARYPKHHSREIVEAFLMLAHRENVTLRQILNEPRHPAYLTLVELITHSPRGGIMRLVLSFLDDTHSPSAGLTALAHRGDQKFIEYLLRKIGFEPAATVAHNLKRLETIPWLQGDLEPLGALDEAAQHAAITLTIRSNLNRRAAFKVLEWMLLRGKTGGRRAAAVLLAGFHGVDGNALLIKALHDRDPQVLATLVKQLRPRGIAGAVGRLLEYLESPFSPVRDAARESLSEFTFARYLAVFDLLEDEVRKSSGGLVVRVDPRAVQCLLEEFQALSRTRRLRAIALTVAMDLVFTLEEALIAKLEDDDHIVRAEAARALAACDTDATQAALETALSDRSTAVQEAAEGSLRELANAPPPQPPLPPWEEEAIV